VTDIGKGFLEGCTSLTSISIPDTVTRIGYGFLNDCSSLTSVTLPEGVTSLSDSLNDCSSLISVTILGSFKDGRYNEFDFLMNCPALETVYVPADYSFQEYLYEASNWFLCPRREKQEDEDSDEYEEIEERYDNLKRILEELLEKCESM
jgi:hypothetical protein